MAKTQAPNKSQISNPENSKQKQTRMVWGLSLGFGFSATPASAPRPRERPADRGRSHSSYRRHSTIRKLVRLLFRNKRRTNRANQLSSRRAARLHSNRVAADLW